MGSLVIGCATSAAAVGSYTSSAGRGLHAHSHHADAPPYGCSAGHSLSHLCLDQIFLDLHKND
jgi:hypothetical protein